MSKIMIMGTNMMSIYNHRLELIKELLRVGHNVSVVAPKGGEEEKLIELGVKFIDTPVDNRGTNAVADLKLIISLIMHLRNERPDLVLTFYTKTNIYGGIACRIVGIPYIENITGLGTAVTSGGLLSKIMVKLYKAAVKKASTVFFQNTQNQQFFSDNKFKLNDSALLPGSGVSLERFKVQDYPADDNVTFLYISRILKEKGIEEFVEAARLVKREYPNTSFNVVGPCDNDFYLDYLSHAEKDGIIKFHGKQFDTKPFIKDSHCTVFPSYYAEGMANVLLESASSGRPVITTDMPGCRETVNDNITGYIVKPKDPAALAAAMVKFINLDHHSKINIGLAGRKKMEKDFDRRIIINAYIKAIDKVLYSPK